MLEKYENVIKRIPSTMRKRIVGYLVGHGLVPGDVPGDSFYESLERARVMQADIVLGLLRMNSRQDLSLAERLIGHPITKCPPALRSLRAKSTKGTRIRSKMDRTVLAVREPSSVDKKRRLYGAPMYQRMRVIKEGMSVASCFARGLWRRDLRVAVRRGYVELSQ